MGSLLVAYGSVWQAAPWNGNKEAGAPSPALLLACCAPCRLTMPPGSAIPGENLIKVTMEMETNPSTPLVTCVYSVCCARRETWNSDGRDSGICGCATDCKHLHSILSWFFSCIKYTSQSRESRQRTEQRLDPAQSCTLPTKELDNDYLIHTSPRMLACIMTRVGNFPNSHENMVFAYLLKQAHQII